MTSTELVQAEVPLSARKIGILYIRYKPFLKMKKYMSLAARLLASLAMLALACDAPKEPQSADVHAALLAAPAASMKPLLPDDIESLDCRPDGGLYTCSFRGPRHPLRPALEPHGHAIGLSDRSAAK